MGSVHIPASAGAVNCCDHSHHAGVFEAVLAEVTHDYYERGIGCYRNPEVELRAKAQRRLRDHEAVAEYRRRLDEEDAYFAALSPAEKIEFNRREYEREVDREEVQFDRQMNWSIEPWELQLARHDIELEKIRKRFAHLLPRFQPWKPTPGFVYPAGYVEQMTDKWLAGEIQRLRAVRDAELTIEIYELQKQVRQ